MLRLLTALKGYFVVFQPRPTLREIIGNELEKESKTVIDSDHVIKTHEFQRHMAVSKINAMQEWLHKEEKNANH